MVTDLLIAARAVHFVATTMVAGTLLFTVLVFDPAIGNVGAAALTRRLRRLLTGSIGIGLATAVLSAAAWLVILSAEISGRPLAATLTSNVVWTVLTQTQFGHDWQLRGALAGLLALVLVLEHRGKPARFFAGAKGGLAAALVGSLAWAGHAAATEGISGDLHVVADALHLLAAAAWLGALAPLGYLLTAAWRGRDPRDADLARATTIRFSTLGIISVSTLLATGIVNTWFLAGSLPALAGTRYGHLLLIKIALFLAMLALASFNRLRLTPGLALPFDSAEARNATHQLARNSVIELILGLVILLIVAALGTLAPGLHVQPVWPFPLRLIDGAIAAPAFQIAIVLIAAVPAAVILLLRGRILPRRMLPAATLAATVVLAVIVVSLRSFTVPAFPTSYQASPNGYTATSIAHGRALFIRHCASCHSDGPTQRPARMASDLTADHMARHTDGDLFWWISHGAGKAMPGFVQSIDDDGRWSLVDFIRANFDGAHLRREEAPGRGFAVPDFTADCPDGTTIAISDLRGSVVHLVVAGANATERLQDLARAPIAPDLVTIVVETEGAPAATASFCTTRDRSVSETFALYAGGEPDAEFLIDAGGQLRAFWSPGRAPAWTDIAVLQQQIAAARDPAAARAAVLHMHQH